MKNIPKAAWYVKPALAVKDMFRATAEPADRFPFAVFLHQNRTPFYPFVPLYTTMGTFYRILGSSVKEKLQPDGCLFDIFWDFFRKNNTHTTCCGVSAKKIPYVECVVFGREFCFFLRGIGPGWERFKHSMIINFYRYHCNLMRLSSGSTFDSFTETVSPGEAFIDGL